MKKLLLLLLLLPGLVFGADVTATTGWSCNDDLPSSVTIDSGDNRLFLVINIQKADNGSGMDHDIATIGGQGETETFLAEHTASGSYDYHYVVWIWNESAIGAMSGTTTSWTDGNDDDQMWVYGTVDDADQTAIGAWDDEQWASSDTTITVTMTSSASDLIVAPAIKGSATSGDWVDAWTTITEVCADNPEFSRDLVFAAGDGGSSSETGTHSGSAGEIGAATFVILNATAASNTALLRRRQL